jgi:hypothetical protein
MSPVRVFRQRLLMCLGLAMVIAGGTAVSMGYLAANDAKSRPALVLTPQESKPVQPTTKKASATTKRTARTIARAKRATAKVVQRKPAAAPTTRAATTRNAVISIDANTATTVSRQYRRMMWWGGGMLAVGLASVGYSIHERRPKPPPSGADELLNDAPPF